MKLAIEKKKIQWPWRSAHCDPNTVLLGAWRKREAKDRVGKRLVRDSQWAGLAIRVSWSAQLRLTLSACIDKREWAVGGTD